MLIPVALNVRAGIFDGYIQSPLSGWTMWGTFAIYGATKPTRRELTAACALGIALHAVYHFICGEPGYEGSLVLIQGVFLGLASLPFLLANSLGRPGERRQHCRKSLTVVGLLSYVGVCLNLYISAARLALPAKLDYFLYAFDGSLGFQASFAAAKLVSAMRPLRFLEVNVYNSLGFWFGFIYAVHDYYRPPCQVSMMRLLVTNACIGFSLYFLFPAMGPKYAFPSFPERPAAVHPAAMLISGLPNAMPSLHFGGALLIYWLSAPWKWLSRLTGAFAALTALATLGLGEHYLVDLVVAAPYALAIVALSSTGDCRNSLIVSSALVFLWIAYLRLGWYVAPLSWILVLGTLATVVALQRKLPIWSEIPAHGQSPGF